MRTRIVVMNQKKKQARTVTHRTCIEVLMVHGEL